MPTIREFEIVFDADGHPNGSLNEYHVGNIRQGDNLTNRFKVKFNSTLGTPTQVQLHAKRPDGSVTPNTELMVALAGTDYFYYDLASWFAEFAGQVYFNCSVSYAPVSGQTPKLFTGTFILSVEGATTSQGNQNLPFETTILDYILLNYYDKTQTDALFINGTRQYIRLDTTPNVDPDTLPAGSLFWDETNHTYAFKDDFGEILEINQHLGDIAKNYDSLTIPEGTPVVFSGVQGSHKLFIRANANSFNTSSIVGVVIRNTPQNEFAFCAVFGDLKVNDFTVLMEGGITAGLTFGSKLYLSATTSGKYTLTAPDRPNQSLWVATVSDYNPSNHKGSMFIYPVRDRLDDGINLQVSLNQPTNQTIGDLWYDID